MNSLQEQPKSAEVSPTPADLPGDDLAEVDVVAAGPDSQPVFVRYDLSQDSVARIDGSGDDLELKKAEDSILNLRNDHFYQDSAGDLVGVGLNMDKLEEVTQRSQNDNDEQLLDVARPSHQLPIVIDLTQDSQDSQEFQGSQDAFTQSLITKFLPVSRIESNIARQTYAEDQDRRYVEYNSTPKPFNSTSALRPAIDDTTGNPTRYNALVESRDIPTSHDMLNAEQGDNHSNRNDLPCSLVDSSDNRRDAPLSSPTSIASVLSMASTTKGNLDIDTSLKVPFNKLTCKERKRMIVSSTRCPPQVKKAMQQWFQTTNHLLDPFREDDDCWFHPSPPPPRLNARGGLRPRGNISRTFAWVDHTGKHNLVVNFGIISKIIFRKMTKLQKDGFINNRWHLSHLCGNWTCLNSDHTTIEPGSVNASRNNCFSHRGGCNHDPKCMKEKKVHLGADGIPVDEKLQFMVAQDFPLIEEDVGDWVTQNFQDDDDDEFLGLENNEVVELEANNSPEAIVVGSESGAVSQDESIF